MAARRSTTSPETCAVMQQHQFRVRADDARVQMCIRARTRDRQVGGAAMRGLVVEFLLGRDRKCPGAHRAAIMATSSCRVHARLSWRHARPRAGVFHLHNAVVDACAHVQLASWADPQHVFANEPPWRRP